MRHFRSVSIALWIRSFYEKHKSFASFLPVVLVSGMQSVHFPFTIHLVMVNETSKVLHLLVPPHSVGRIPRARQNALDS